MKRKVFVNKKDGVYNVSDRYPMIYVNMPKCACTTIKNYMYYLDNDSWYSNPLYIHKHLSSEDSLDLVADRLEGFCFTFVRHPVKRAFSAFHEKIIYEGKYSFPNIKKYIENNYHVDLSSSSDPKVVEKQFYKFLCFVSDNIKGKTNVRKDPHWLPQSMILNKYQKLRRLDFVGRIESFSEDFQFVLNKVSAPEIDIGKKFNEGPRPECSLSDIRSNRVDVMAASVFECDQAAFGYNLKEY